MQVLVTGGAGFIGSHLVDALIKRGDDVLVLDNLSSGKREHLNARATFIEADVRDVGTQAHVRAFRPEVIFHLAAQKSVPESLKHPRNDADVNLVGLTNLLEAIPGLGLQQFIFASTGGAMYGDQATIPADESQPANPTSPYGVAKFASERYLTVWGALHGFTATSLRLANVYGPRQDPYGEAGVVAIFCKRAVSGQPMRIFGTGEHTRDYVYVTDVVAAFLAALEVRKAGTFNIGTGLETSVRAIMRILEEQVGTSLSVDQQPEVVGEMARSALSAQKAADVLGWKPTTTFAAGISQTHEWFKKQERQ